MALSDFAVRSAKPKRKAYRLTDGDGLNLLVRPNGSKLWQLRYRFRGKENILSFGKYPIVSLADARRKRDGAKRLLSEDIDPAAQRKLDKIADAEAARTTFGLIAEEHLVNLEAKGLAESTMVKNRWMLNKLAAPLANRPIKDITPAEVLHLLKRIETSGRQETARKLRGALSSVFRYAIATLRAENDPTFPLRDALQAPKRTGRAAIIDEKEFGVLLRTLDEYTGWPTIVAAMKFQILTCTRPGEVRGTIRSEIDFENAIWRIPAERMKMRRPHEVPLSRQAITVLQDVWPLSEGAELVFPSVRSNVQQLSENAFNAALRRMGYTKDEVTAHGFRVTASTILNSRGYDPDVIEAVLAHQDRNAIRRAYNRANYWEQRVELMREWADLLDALMLLQTNSTLSGI
jgi:integrase